MTTDFSQMTVPGSVFLVYQTDGGSSAQHRVVDSD